MELTCNLYIHKSEQSDLSSYLHSNSLEFCSISTLPKICTTFLQQSFLFHSPLQLLVKSNILCPQSPLLLFYKHLKGVDQQKAGVQQ